MPTPLSTAFLVFGAVLTALTVVGGVVVAGIGLLIEIFLFWQAGLDGR